ARLPAKLGLREALLSLHSDDLYLSCACGQEDPRALACFEERILRRMPALLASLSPSTAQIDEVSQLLRAKLFVTDGTSRGRIEEYSGSGALQVWVRITALRIALNLLRDKDDRRAARDGTVLERLAATGEDPEAAYLKTRYRDAFLAACRDAMHELAGEERT